MCDGVALALRAGRHVAGVVVQGEQGVALAGARARPGEPRLAGLARVRRGRLLVQRDGRGLLGGVVPLLGRSPDLLTELRSLLLRVPSELGLEVEVPLLEQPHGLLDLLVLLLELQLQLLDPLLDHLLSLLRENRRLLGSWRAPDRVLCEAAGILLRGRLHHDGVAALLLLQLGGLLRLLLQLQGLALLLHLLALQLHRLALLLERLALQLLVLLPLLLKHPALLLRLLLKRLALLLRLQPELLLLLLLLLLQLLLLGLEACLLGRQVLPLHPLPLLLRGPLLLLASQLSLAPLLGLGGTLPGDGDPGLEARLQEGGPVQGRDHALAALRANLGPLPLGEADGVEGADEAAASGQPPLLDALLGSLDARQQARSHHGHLAQHLRGALHLDLRDELRDIEAELHRVHGAGPLLADDAAHDRGQLVRIRRHARVAHVLERLHLPGLQEEARHAKGPLLARHVVGQHQGLDEGAHAVALELLRQELAEARGDLLEAAAVRVAVVHDLDELDGAALHELLENELVLEVARLLLRVGLEAADVVQVAGAQRLEEGLQVLHVLLADGAEESLAAGVLLPEGLHEGQLGVADEGLALRQQAVVVLVQPALRVVLHHAGVVLDGEATVHTGTAGHAGALPAGHLELLEDVLARGVLLRLLDHLLAEVLVAGIADALRELLTVLVQRFEDGADAVGHRRGVRQVQTDPRQALALVERLLRDEDVLDEVLLEPLVGEVDAQLLEGIQREALEAVDVEDADVVPLALAGLVGHLRAELLEAVVDALHGELEETLVEGLDEAEQRLAELRLAAGDLVEGVAAGDGHLLARQTGLELVRVHAQHLGSVADALLVDLHHLLVIVVRLLGVRDLVLRDVAEVDDAGEDVQHGVDVGLLEADGLQAIAEPLEVLGVVLLGDLRRRGAVRQQPVALLGVEQELVLEPLLASAVEHLVEAVVGALAGAVHHDAGALQQVRGDARVHEGARAVEEDAVVLAEARGVRVPHGHRVAERLQDRLRLQDARLDLRGEVIRGPRGVGKVVHDDLGSLRLASAALAGDEQALVPLLAHQSAVRGVRDGVRVRGQGTDVLAAVPLALLLAIQALDLLVGVHRKEHTGRVGVDLILLVPQAEVLQDRRVVHVHQRRVVLAGALVVALEARPHVGEGHGVRLLVDGDIDLVTAEVRHLSGEEDGIRRGRVGRDVDQVASAELVHHGEPF
mmetsp:Transcript_17422/g.38376  ORF Transcript_17422/g.38376 Transcript_17422/m.38376 type:complete len:1202 (-) Transcript_17422:85-3690(-)